MSQLNQFGVNFMKGESVERKDQLEFDELATNFENNLQGSSIFKATTSK